MAVVDIAAIKLNDIPELLHERVAGSLNAQHVDDLNDVVAGGVPRVHSWLAKHLQEQSASLPESCRFATGPHLAGTEAFGEPGCQAKLAKMLASLPGHVKQSSTKYMRRVAFQTGSLRHSRESDGL